jgi:hypothetical protein
MSITNWIKNHESGHPSLTCHRCGCLHHQHHPPACPHHRCRYPADGARIWFHPIRSVRCRPVAGGGNALEKGTRGERSMGLARVEEEERARWEKRRGRRSNLGFAGRSPRLLPQEREAYGLDENSEEKERMARLGPSRSGLGVQNHEREQR